MSMPLAIAIVIATLSFLGFSIYTAIQDENYILFWAVILCLIVLIEPCYSGWRKGKANVKFK